MNKIKMGPEAHDISHACGSGGMQGCGRKSKFCDNRVERDREFGSSDDRRCYP